MHNTRVSRFAECWMNGQNWGGAVVGGNEMCSIHSLTQSAEAQVLALSRTEIAETLRENLIYSRARDAIAKVWVTVYTYGVLSVLRVA